MKTYSGKRSTSLSARLLPLLSMSLSSKNKFILMLMLVLITLPHFASSAELIEEVAENVAVKTYSTGQPISELNSTTQQQLLASLKQSITLGNSDQLQKKSTRISRDEVINEKLHQASKLVANNDDMNNAEITGSLKTRTIDGAYFIVYEGYSTLIEDNDGDGYYQTFSISFDVDLISYNPYDKALIYAELYLSENGRPWEHYYTTDNFVIMGESSEDAFECIAP